MPINTNVNLIPRFGKNLPTPYIDRIEVHDFEVRVFSSIYFHRPEQVSQDQIDEYIDETLKNLNICYVLMPEGALSTSFAPVTGNSWWGDSHKDAYDKILIDGKIDFEQLIKADPKNIFDIIRFCYVLNGAHIYTDIQGGRIAIEGSNIYFPDGDIPTATGISHYTIPKGLYADKGNIIKLETEVSYNAFGEEIHRVLLEKIIDITPHGFDKFGSAHAGYWGMSISSGDTAAITYLDAMTTNRIKFNLFSFSTTLDLQEMDPASTAFASSSPMGGSDVIDWNLNHWHEDSYGMKDLVLKQISDVVYEQVSKDGRIRSANRQVLKIAATNEPYIDGDVLQAIDSLYHADNSITRVELVEAVEAILEQPLYSQQRPDSPFNYNIAQQVSGIASNEEELQSIVNNIRHILSIHGSKSDILVQLNNYRKIIPQRSTATPAGEFYERFETAIYNLNNAVKKGEQLVKSINLSPITYDLRTETSVLELPERIAAWSSRIPDDFGNYIKTESSLYCCYTDPNAVSTAPMADSWADIVSKNLLSGLGDVSAGDADWYPAIENLSRVWRNWGEDPEKLDNAEYIIRKAWTQKFGLRAHRPDEDYVFPDSYNSWSIRGTGCTLGHGYEDSAVEFMRYLAYLFRNDPLLQAYDGVVDAAGEELDYVSSTDRQGCWYTAAAMLGRASNFGGPTQPGWRYYYAQMYGDPEGILSIGSYDSGVSSKRQGLRIWSRCDESTLSSPSGAGCSDIIEVISLDAIYDLADETEDHDLPADLDTVFNYYLDYVNFVQGVGASAGRYVDPRLPSSTSRASDTREDVANLIALSMLYDTICMFLDERVQQITSYNTYVFGYWFFDLEMAINEKSILSYAFDVQKVENLFTRQLTTAFFKLNQTNINRYEVNPTVLYSDAVDREMTLKDKLEALGHDSHCYQSEDVGTLSEHEAYIGTLTTNYDDTGLIAENCRITRAVHSIDWSGGGSGTGIIVDPEDMAWAPYPMDYKAISYNDEYTGYSAGEEIGTLGVDVAEHATKEYTYCSLRPLQQHTATDTYRQIFENSGLSPVSTWFTPDLVRANTEDVYRLMTFEHQEVLNGFLWNYEVGSHPLPTTYLPFPYSSYTYRLQFIDSTNQIVYYLLNSWFDVYEGDFDSYYDLATEQCSYNEESGEFNSFFKERAATAYEELATAPWWKMACMYHFHLDLIYDLYNGDKELIMEAAIQEIDKIKPDTGSMLELVSFKQKLDKFTDDNYRLGGVNSIIDRLNDVYFGGEPRITSYHNIETAFGGGENIQFSNNYHTSTGKKSAPIPFPINLINTLKHEEGTYALSIPHRITAANRHLRELVSIYCVNIFGEDYSITGDQPIADRVRRGYKPRLGTFYYMYNQTGYAALNSALDEQSTDHIPGYDGVMRAEWSYTRAMGETEISDSYYYYEEIISRAVAKTTIGIFFDVVLISPAINYMDLSTGTNIRALEKAAEVLYYSEVDTILSNTATSGDEAEWYYDALQAIAQVAKDGLWHFEQMLHPRATEPNPHADLKWYQIQNSKLGHKTKFKNWVATMFFLIARMARQSEGYLATGGLDTADGAIGDGFVQTVQDIINSRLDAGAGDGVYDPYDGKKIQEYLKELIVVDSVINLYSGIGGSYAGFDHYDDAEYAYELSDTAVDFVADFMDDDD